MQGSQLRPIEARSQCCRATLLAATVRLGVPRIKVAAAIGAFAKLRILPARLMVMRKIPFCLLNIRLQRGIKGILHSNSTCLFLRGCRIAFLQTNCDHLPTSFLSFLRDNHNTTIAQSHATVKQCQAVMEATYDHVLFFPVFDLFPASFHCLLCFSVPNPTVFLRFYFFFLCSYFFKFSYFPHCSVPALFYIFFTYVLFLFFLSFTIFPFNLLCFFFPPLL